MNWDTIEGNWKQLKGRARQKWGELTEDDLDKAAGRRGELVGVLQERYGKAKEQVEREVDQWIARLNGPGSKDEASTGKEAPAEARTSSTSGAGSGR